jgi:hypothetical protein
MLWESDDDCEKKTQSISLSIFFYTNGRILHNVK